MTRWRANAEARGVSFSQHIRDCLRISELLDHVDRENLTLVISRLGGVDAGPAPLRPDTGPASTGPATVQTPAAGLVERAERLAAERRRDVKPDPKPKP